MYNRIGFPADRQTVRLAMSQPTASTTPRVASREELQNAFDASLFYILTQWAPLSLAVTNSWAGALTNDKRDWFVGAVSTLFDTHPATDALDLEEVMLQVMADEFDVEVQDDSAAEVAEEIIRVRARIVGEGDMALADEVKARWAARGGARAAAGAGYVNAGEKEVETDAEEDEDDDEDDEDEDMLDAPALVTPKQPREKVEPEVDEEGFTKVVSRRKR